jgi:hypothetical protein
MEYLESLCDILKSSLLTLNSSSEDEGEADVTCASSCVYSLYALIKNPKLVERGTITAMVFGILLRLSCYGEGTTPELILSSASDSTDSKKKKKSSKKSSTNSNSSLVVFTENGISVELATRVVSLIRRVEGVVQGKYNPADAAGAADGGSSPSSGLVALVRAARSRFLTMLSELTYQTIDGMNTNATSSLEANEDQETKSPSAHTGPTFLQFANALLHHFEANGLVSHKQLNEEGQEEEDEELSSLKDLLKEMKTTMTSLNEQLAESVPPKLIHSFEVLLSQTTFHILCSDEVELEPLRVMLRVLPQILSKYKVKLQKDPESSATLQSDDEDEDDDDPQAELLDCCLDLLAVPASHSIKGIRDAIKKIWINIIHSCGLHQDGLEAVLLAVIGEDTMQEDGDDEDNDAESDQEPEENGDDEEVEEEEEESEQEEEEEEADGSSKQNRQVTEEEVLQLLEEDGFDLGDDDEDDVLAHVESADEALVQMIKMRKQSRKQGLLQAKRQEYIIRSRAVDILEVCHLLLARQLR